MKPDTDGYCSAFFSALANKLRVRILQQLSLTPMTVNELAEKVEAERTLVSHNLALLAKAQLVRYNKVGNTRVYSANEYVVPYVFFMLERVVCSRCSIRKTCKALRERGVEPMQPVEQICKGVCKVDSR